MMFEASFSNFMQLAWIATHVDYEEKKKLTCFRSQR